MSFIHRFATVFPSPPEVDRARLLLCELSRREPELVFWVTPRYAALTLEWYSEAPDEYRATVYLADELLLMGTADSIAAASRIDPAAEGDIATRYLGATPTPFACTPMEAASEAASGVGGKP